MLVRSRRPDRSVCYGQQIIKKLFWELTETACCDDFRAAPRARYAREHTCMGGGSWPQNAWISCYRSLPLYVRRKKNTIRLWFEAACALYTPTEYIDRTYNRLGHACMHVPANQNHTTSHGQARTCTDNKFIWASIYSMCICMHA